MPRFKYSPQAAALMSELKADFPVEEFEKFVEDNFFIVGGNHVLLFIEEKGKQKQAFRNAINPLNQRQ